MPKKSSAKSRAPETFPQRLTRLRKDAGYTQSELAAELGISRRMMHYYETQGGQPMTELLPALARALGVTADQMLGLAPITARRAPKDSRLERKLSLVQKLPPEDRRQIALFIDTLVERQKLRDRTA